MFSTLVTSTHMRVAVLVQAGLCMQKCPIISAITKLSISLKGFSGVANWWRIVMDNCPFFLPFLFIGEFFQVALIMK